MQERNLQVSRAWKLRKDFKSLFESISLKEAIQYLQLWINRVILLGIQEVATVTNGFRNHFQGVCHALCCPQSNAKAVRFNGRIQEIKVIGRRLPKV